ncbi:MAG: hypothetical protein JO199_00385 [Candidatus Eremiobacteraeota bacterium]|nr:hypothetical protein [Candidatus Eremiobacteraeota bacterium]
MNLRMKHAVAWIALVALAACSGPSASPGLPASSSSYANALRGHARVGLLREFVGVGDSLTAGYQAGGFLGQANVKNPLAPGTLVRPGQENGYWADVDEAISGLPISDAIAYEYTPSISPLPLIAGPGLNNQLVPSTTGTAPIGQLKSGDACTADNGFNAKGYLLSGNAVTRIDPSDSSIRDFGVPGITLHEANVLFAPQTNTCEPLPGVPGLLSAVTAGESSVFWPVLGNFAGMHSNLSEVKAAASLHPTLATVWLGANDVLKYMGSGGRFVGGDQSAAQVQTDLVKSINTLRYAGAKVVVADLPSVLRAPYFMRVDVNPPARACKIQTYVFCLLVSLGFPPTAPPSNPANATYITNAIAQAYGLATPGGCDAGSTTKPCGYVVLPGALGALAYFLTTSKLPNLDCSGTNFTPPCVKGSGLGGYYITPAFAGQIQALNNAVNTGIHQSAQQTNVPLVPILQIFDGIASGNPNNPYFKAATSIAPGVCCTLTYNGGFTSFDGLHPSNTGYGLVANAFIDTINAAYGQKIPQADVVAIYKGTRCSNKKLCFPDYYAPPYNGQQIVRAHVIERLRELHLR